MTPAPGSIAAAPRGPTAQLADLALPAAMLTAILVVFAPLPAGVIDLLLAANLTVAVLALLGSIAARTPLEMAAFPTFLLAATLVRLVLNIATTRLILTRAAIDGEAAAGEVVQAFGGFVSGNSLVVGGVIFAIIAVVQLIVITAGASRTGEVAARFTLDSLPGRQMAIDAELQSGSISPAAARDLRRELQRQADFFAGMDGAGRFVRGEAIAGVIITLVNLAGGLAIGVVQQGMPPARAAEVFSRLTIGDGLVTSLASLLVSVAMGLLISRSTTAMHLPTELGRQFAGDPRVLAVAACFVGVLAMTGLPTWPLAGLAGLLGLAAWKGRRSGHQPDGPEAEAAVQTAKPESIVASLLDEDTPAVELGRDLIYLVAGSAATLPERTRRLRDSLAADLGLVLPKVVFRDSTTLPPRQCRIVIGGEEVFDSELPGGRVLAVGGVAFEGPAGADPLSGVDGTWIAARQLPEARAAGCTILETSDVVMRALEAAVRHRAGTLLTRDAVSRLVESIRGSHPAVVDGVIPELLPLPMVHRTLQQLVREGVPIRPLPLLLEIMADHAAEAGDPERLTEQVRQGLARTICRRARDGEGRLPTVRLTEATVTAIDREGPQEGTGRFDRQRLVAEVRRAVRPGRQRGSMPVVVVPPSIRRRVREMLAASLPEVQVLSTSEIAGEERVEIFATVGDGALRAA